MPDTRAQNRSTEDYIKSIFKLEREGQKVTTSSIATNLQLSDPSVTDMVKKLSDKGYLKYAPYKGVQLTAAGKRMALKIVRRHRLWEMFLVKFLGFSWDQIHDEAERLEHVTSDDLEQALDRALGHPTVDPHGDPIPSADGEIEHAELTPLSGYATGARVRIARISDHDAMILQHATQLGMKLNTKLVVKEHRKFDGSMLVKVGSKQQFISQQVADAIFVERLG